jgi:hypothetical protein
MKNNKKWKVIKELFINDLVIGTCFWSLILPLFIPFFKLPQSLAVVFYIFFTATCIICLPFALYKVRIALYLAKMGVEVTGTNVSIEPFYFGRRAKFEYEYDGQTYHKAKFYHSIFFTEKDRLKVLVDPGNPSEFIILEFKKKSPISVASDRKS